MHQVADILTAAAEVVFSSPRPTGTASIPEPISPIHPRPTGSHPHPHPGHPGVVHWEGVGHFGHVVAWVTFAIFALSFLGFLFSTVRKPLATKLLSLLLLAASIVSSATYFSFATGHGSGLDFYPKGDVFHARQVFYGHFAQWVVTTPLVLAATALFAGLPTIHVVLIALAGAATDIFSAVGTFVKRGHGPGGFGPGLRHRHHHGSSAWGWLVFSLLPMIYVTYTLLVPGRLSSLNRSPTTARLYLFLALWELVFFLPYVLLEVLGTWLHLFGPKVEFLAYAILDVLTQVVFGFVLLFGLRRNPEAEVVLGESWVTPGGGYAYEPIAQEEGVVPVPAT